MGKHVLSMFIKISPFIAAMLIVAKVAPYDGLVDSTIALFDYQDTRRFTYFILSGPDLEPWECLRFYFSFLINTLISLPIMSAVIIFLTVLRLK